MPLIIEVEQHWAKLVLGWVTAWEYPINFASILIFPKPESSKLDFSHQMSPLYSPSFALYSCFVAKLSNLGSN